MKASIIPAISGPKFFLKGLQMSVTRMTKRYTCAASVLIIAVGGVLVAASESDVVDNAKELSLVQTSDALKLPDMKHYMDIPSEYIQFASAQDAMDYVDRAENGAAKVVRMYALTQDYLRGFMTFEDVERQIWIESPKLAAAVYGMSMDPIWVMPNLVIAQTNGVIGYDSEGIPFFFDISEYLDEAGQVIPRFAIEFNIETRANKILLETIINLDSILYLFDPMRPVNNQCCGGQTSNTCVSMTEATCYDIGQGCDFPFTSCSK